MSINLATAYNKGVSGFVPLALRPNPRLSARTSDTHKIRVYLDTSVISALFDERNPERETLTKTFFKEIGKLKIKVVSLYS